MGILSVLGIGSANDIDVTRPISVGSLLLGVEAAQEAVNVLNTLPVGFECRFKSQSVPSPVYWEIFRDGGRIGEVFGFPSGFTGNLPTAVEVAIIRALELANPTDSAAILSGNVLVSSIQSGHSMRFHELITVVEPPLCGTGVLTTSGIILSLRPSCDERLTDVVVGCLKSSFICAPIKFRFVELYRVMEARFMSDILAKLNDTFLAGPKAALDTANASLSSELNQLISIGAESEVYFERIRGEIFALRDSGNDYARALIGKLHIKGHQLNASQFKSGAAFVYYARCSIVHSGEKDLIYDTFPDAEAVLAAIMRDVECAALSVCGIDVT